MLTLPLLEPDAAYALWAATYPPIAHNPLMQAEERAMLSLLPASLVGRCILDAGCGSGRYLAHARQRHARTVMGIDRSEPMLCRAKAELPGVMLIRAALEALPLRSHLADITLCGLTLGHCAELETSLAELCRVTRPGGMILVSDIHPVGRELGWQRDFKANGQKYLVQHVWRDIADWQQACQAVGLRIAQILEPRLNPADIPPGARFDTRALCVPVALVLALQKPEAVESDRVISRQGAREKR